MQQIVPFSSGIVKYILNGNISQLPELAVGRNYVVVTDSNLLNLYPDLNNKAKVICLQPGEQTKSIETIEQITRQLLKLEATRKTLLVGVGGGVITDFTGYLGATYMRGIKFGFVPTTLLAMVDAAIGGKNGVNVGLNKNILGTITQPEFILYYLDFLQTLPDEEWSNGFAEIIKYACLFDAVLFEELSNHSIGYYKQNAFALHTVIEKCVAFKNRTVAEDEHETGVRKLLNFGHTAAHAIETLYNLAHGQAVAIGMVIACRLSEDVLGLKPAATALLRETFKKYNLPTHYKINVPAAMQLLKMDKKRQQNTIDYILLEEIGKPKIQPLPFETIEKAINQCVQ